MPELKAPFIATQLNSTRCQVELCRYKRGSRPRVVIWRLRTLRCYLAALVWRRFEFSVLCRCHSFTQNV